MFRKLPVAACCAAFILTAFSVTAHDVDLEDAASTDGARPTLSDYISQGYVVVGTTQGTSSSSTIYHLLKGNNVVRCKIQHAHAGKGICA